MNLNEFNRSLQNDTPPVELTVQMKALWWEAKGDWQRAHDLIDHLHDSISAHIHAYLHRVEGDLWNARYWYNSAKQPEFKGYLTAERLDLLDLYL